tara:strand:- start:555 stop:749 length:195 start_codon:yes stop_codon:yes gene_type:complete
MEERKTLLYNIKSLPSSMTLEDVIEIYYATGVLVYEGILPYVVDVDNLNHDIVLTNYKEWLNLN